jgi:cobalt-zinc-cadmium efflux system membrane fusion protein
MEPVAGKLIYDETRTARVSSPIAGRVMGNIASLGQRVAKGDVLVELDSPELGQAQADEAKARADQQLAEHAYQRVKNLFDNGVAPRKDLEQAQDDLARARSEADRARLRLSNLGVAGGRADDRFRLHAPIAGVVTERKLNPGLEVRPDMPDPLFVISDLGRLWVQMDIFEKDLGLIRVGQQVRVSVPAFPDQPLTAVVDYIGQVVDDTTRTVKVRCLLDNPTGRLLPAMYASVEPLSAPGDQAIVVPLTALFTEGESDWAFVALGEGIYQKRPVKVGLRLKDRAVIASGLNVGERLIVDGALLLRTEEDAEQAGAEATP